MVDAIRKENIGEATDPPTYPYEIAWGLGRDEFLCHLNKKIIFGYTPIWETFKLIYEGEGEVFQVVVEHKDSDRIGKEMNQFYLYGTWDLEERIR